ncbi:MAG: efflux RND transporter periplasmic adaptor subunit [Thermomicrobiales bacterium]|nr:efflux RND transporter periplasmic adaptor subunit [Thermomicrobiales bacterium]
MNVTVQTIEPVAELPDTFELTGVVQPRAIVRVAAEVTGRIESYGKRAAAARGPGGSFGEGSPIDEGQPVTAGDPLILLNRDLLQARHDRAAAQYENDEQEYQRILRLYERSSAPPTEMRQARTRRDVSKAELDEAARSLERATIVAPMSGLLNDLPMEPGEYASPGDVVAEIVDIDTVKVLVDVPERDIGYLRVGQSAEVLPLSTEAASVEGKITYINALANDSTRTTRIEVTVQNRRDDAAADGSHGDYHLRSGQIVKVRLTRRMLKDAIMVPLASVIPLEEGKEVYVVENGKAERRPVELGFIRGRSIQVRSGLKQADQLIVAGHRLVSPGQPVNVVTGEGKTDAATR